MRPASHPIQANFTTYSEERCSIILGNSYEKTKPEMCYTTPADVGADGCRVSLKWSKFLLDQYFSRYPQIVNLER